MFKRAQNIREVPATGFAFPVARRAAFIVALGLSLAGGYSARAQVVWANTAGNTNFNAGGSWVGGAVPSSSQTGVFSAASVTAAPSVTGSISVGGIEFASGTAAWTLTTPNGANATLTIGSSGIVNNSSNTQTITSNSNDMTILLGAAAAFTSNGTGALTFNSSLKSINNGGNLLTLNGTSTSTSNSISEVITGAGGLTKSGIGTWVMNANHNYDGVTTISGGILSISNVANGGAASHLGDSNNAAANLVLNGGTLRFTGAADSTNRRFTIGTAGGTIDASGSGALSFTNSNSHASSGTGNRTLTLTGTNTGSNTISGALVDPSSGTLSLAKSGNGLWVLSGASTFTGTTTISAGTLRLGNNERLSNATAVTVASGAIFDLVNYNETVGSIAGAGTIRLTGNNNRLFTVGGDNSSTTFSGTLEDTGSGRLSLTKTGNGVLTLSGTNTHAGVTTLSGGTLSVGNIGNGGSVTGNLSAATNAAGNLVFNGGTLRYTGASASTNRSFTINAATTGTIDIADGGANLTISGASANTTGALTKTGAGTLTLSGANLHTGLTTVSAGTLAYGASNVLSTGGVTVDGGTAILALGANRTDTVGTVTVANGGSITGTGTSALTSTGTFEMQSGSVSAILAGTGIALNKTTSGTVTLSGANTYTGVTTLSDGTLSVSSINNGGVAGNLGQASSAAGNLVFNGGTLSYTGASASTNRSFTITGGSTGTIAVTSGAANLTFSGVSANTTGALVKAGNGILTLSGANQHTGATTVSAGTLRYGVDNALSASSPVTVSGGATLDLNAFNATLGSLSGTGTVDLSGASVSRTLTISNTADATFSGTITDSGSGSALSLLKTGSAAFTLAGTNSYSGNTTVNAGTLRISADANLGAAPGSPSAASITLGGGSLNATSTFTLNSNRGTTLTAATTSNLTANNGQILTYGGVITGSGNLTFGTATTGTGVIELTGNSNYTGTTTINHGALRYGTDNALSTTAAVTINSPGVLDLRSYNATIGSLAGNGTVDLGGASVARTLTVGDATSTTFSGTLTDSGGGSALSLTKQGSGTLELSGTNTHTGLTNVNAGTLRISADANLGTAPGSPVANKITLGGGTLEAAASFTLNSNRGTTLTAATSSNVTATSGNTLTYGGVIAGTGNIAYGTAVTGTGTVGLSGNSTYTGTTTFNAGTVAVTSIGNGGVAGNLGQATNAAGNLVFNGGTLQYNGTTASTDRGFTINNGQTGTIDVASGATNLTISGSSASTTGALTKTGTGTLTLTGTNLHSGTTTVSQGTLVAGSAGALGDSAGNATVSSGATLAIAPGFTITKTGTLTLSGTGTSATSGALHASGGTGTTSHYRGNIQLAAPATVTAADNLLILGNGVSFANTLDLGAHTLTLHTPDAAAVTPTYLPVPAYTLDASNLLVNSRLIGTGGLIKSGSGTVNINAGSAAGNTFTGDTVITGGKLIVDGVTNKPGINSNQIYIGNSSSPGAADSVVLQMGQLASPPASNNTIGTYNVVTNASASSLTIYEDGLFHMNRASNGFVDLTLRGGHVTGGNLASNPNLTLTGSLTTLASSQTALIEQNNLRMSANAFAFTIADGSAAVDLQIDSRLQNGIGYTGGDSGISMTKAGTGTMVLTNANTYSGVTDITAGVLNIRHNEALGQVGSFLGHTDNGTIVRSGAQLQLQGGLTIGQYETLTLNGTGVSGTGALRNVSGDNTYNGFVLLNAATNRLQADSGTTLTIANTSGVDANIINGTAAGRDLVVGGAGNTTINGGIAANVGSLTKVDDGTLTLAGLNSYAGATSVSDGIVKVTHNSGLAGSGVTVSTDASLHLAQTGGGADISVVGVATSISGTGTAGEGALHNLNGSNSYAGLVTVANNATITAAAGSSLTLSSGTSSTDKQLTVGSVAHNGNVTIAGMSNGTGALVKNGTGTLTISGASATVGAVAMNGGTLNFNSTTTNTGVVNANAGTTNFNGTTANTGNINLNGGDINVSGATTVNADAVSAIAGTTLTIATGGHVIADYASGTTTFSGALAGGGNFEKTGGGTLVFDQSFTASDLTLTLNGGTLSLLAGAFAFETIHITGNTILDFNNSTGTVLSSVNLIIEAGVSVTVNNWVSVANNAGLSTVWYATSTVNGGTLGGSDLVGGTPLGQITFPDYPGQTSTWVSGNHNGWFDHEIRPTPEPATYGAMLLGGSFLLLGWRRWRRSRLAAPVADVARN